MFGLFNKKKAFMKQFRRAVSIENVLKMGIFSHLIESNGYNSTDKEPPKRAIILYGAAINYIFCDQIDADPGEEISREAILSAAQQILDSDVNLERVIVRTIYDIASLSLLIDKDNWSNEVLAHHPRLIEFIVPYREKYPELFSDVTEKEFESLFNNFIRVYSPSMKDVTSSLF